MQKLDIFNEVTTIMLVYVILCFSAANINGPRNELPLDAALMAFLCQNLFVHLYFLIKDSCISAKEKCKKGKCCACCRKNKASSAPLAKYEASTAAESKAKIGPLDVVKEEGSDEYDEEDDDSERQGNYEPYGDNDSKQEVSSPRLRYSPRGRHTSELYKVQNYRVPHSKLHPHHQITDVSKSNSSDNKAGGADGQQKIDTQQVQHDTSLL